MTSTGFHPGNMATTASAAVLALLMASCSSDAPDGAPNSGAPSTVNDEPAPSAPVSIPDTAVGEVTDHVLEVVNSDQDSTAEDWEGLLSESFRSEIDETQLAEVLNQSILPGSPWTATEYQGTETQSTTRVEGSAGELNLVLQIDADDQVVALFWQEVPELPEAATSFDELEDRIDELPGDAKLLVVEDGEELLSVGSGDPTGVGSVFKLWVLLALVEAVEEGDTSWDETLELGQEHMSLPSGELQLEEPGFEISVRDASQAMIEKSDNTATDLLIRHVGRDAVEEAIDASGHHQPELMRPLMTTREVFQLRWEHEALGQEYTESDEDRQYAILEELAQKPFELAPEEVEVDDGAARGLEWFATPEDVAAVYQELESFSGDHHQLREILGANPAVVADRPWWDDLAFKGGSSPGVLAASWHAVSDEGTSRTVVLQVSGEPEMVHEAELEYWSLAEGSLTLDAP